MPPLAGIPENTVACLQGWANFKRKPFVTLRLHALSKAFLFFRVTLPGNLGSVPFRFPHFIGGLGFRR
jgi:hypothetical protein